MSIKSVLISSSLSLFAAQTFAGTMGVENKPYTFVATLSAGPAWESEGETQTFYLTDTVEKTYATNKSSNSLGTGELFGGIQKTINEQVKGQLGLAIAVAGNAGLEGHIWDDADPQFNNYIYRYKVIHSRIAAKGKLIADGAYWLMPWVSGSVGVAFNTAHDFYNFPTIFQAVQNPNFSDHTKTSFTYTVGAGVQKALNAHWQVGIGYEFADWGKSELGRAAGQTMNSGLALNHIYTHGALLNLTYIA